MTDTRLDDLDAGLTGLGEPARVEHQLTEGIDLERRVFMGRKRSRTELDVYFASLSPRTIVYKGMLLAGQVGSVTCSEIG